MFVSLFSLNERNSEQIEVSVLRNKLQWLSLDVRAVISGVQEKRTREGNAEGMRRERRKRGGKGGGRKGRKIKRKRKRKKEEAGTSLSAPFRSISMQDLGALCKHHPLDGLGIFSLPGCRLHLRTNLECEHVAGFLSLQCSQAPPSESASPAVTPAPAVGPLPSAGHFSSGTLA